jgi:hypothetical protein
VLAAAYVPAWQSAQRAPLPALRRE